MIHFEKFPGYLAHYYNGSSEFADFGLLALRGVWGFLMLLHSLPMARHPFGWMNKPPYPPTPAIFQAFAAATMFSGSFAVMAGFLFPFGALGLVGIMAVALTTHLRAKDPLLRAMPNAPVDNYEGSLAYLFIGICLITTGPGRFSLDAWLLPLLAH
jgi:uncharacterized membrane protein YphA (DoxX/SURF4 family)